MQDIRWQQRFRNYENAFLFFEQIIQKESLTEIEKAGLVHAYEFTFELAWKTMKDYLEAKDIPVKFPREVIKESFRYDLIADGETWMDMLDKRNLMTHTYDETSAKTAIMLIQNNYYSLLRDLYNILKNDIR